MNSPRVIKRYSCLLFSVDCVRLKQRKHIKQTPHFARGKTIRCAVVWNNRHTKQKRNRMTRMRFNIGKSNTKVINLLFYCISDCLVFIFDDDLYFLQYVLEIETCRPQRWNSDDVTLFIGSTFFDKHFQHSPYK